MNLLVLTCNTFKAPEISTLNMDATIIQANKGERIAVLDKYTYKEKLFSLLDDWIETIRGVSQRAPK
jgi:hypothetical protein